MGGRRTLKTFESSCWSEETCVRNVGRKWLGREWGCLIRVLEGTLVDGQFWGWLGMEMGV